MKSGESPQTGPPQRMSGIECFNMIVPFEKPFDLQMKNSNINLIILSNYSTQIKSHPCPITELKLKFPAANCREPPICKEVYYFNALAVHFQSNLTNMPNQAPMSAKNRSLIFLDSSVQLF